MRQSTVYRKRDRTVTRRIAGETLLVPVKGNLADMEHVFVLEGAGDFVWERIDGHRPIGDIAAELAEEFGVDKDCTLADVEEFTAELLEADLIE